MSAPGAQPLPLGLQEARGRAENNEAAYRNFTRGRRPSSGQREVHLNRGFNFYRLAIQ